MTPTQRVCDLAVGFALTRIHGGYGYMSEFETERDLRDAIGGTLYSGTSDIQRMNCSLFRAVDW